MMQDMTDPIGTMAKALAIETQAAVDSILVDRAQKPQNRPPLPPMPPGANHRTPSLHNAAENGNPGLSEQGEVDKEALRSFDSFLLWGF